MPCITRKRIGLSLAKILQQCQVTYKKVVCHYSLQEAKESFASPDQRFGMKTEVYFVSLRQ